MAHRRSTVSNIMEVFSVNPVPYPLLLFFAVIFLFLGIKCYVTYESVVEAAEENMGWLLMAAPIVILIAVRWLSTLDVNNNDPPGGGLWWFFGNSPPPWDGRRRGLYQLRSEGSSPWGVAALILLLLVLVQYQSSFLESWFI